MLQRFIRAGGMRDVRRAVAEVIGKLGEEPDRHDEIEQQGLGRVGNHVSCRIVSRASVFAIRPAFGVPRASASTMWRACLKLTFGGSGGSSPSTTASMSAGPGEPKASRKVEAHCAGSSTVKPFTPHARATAA